MHDDGGHELLVKQTALLNPFARKKALFFLTEQNYITAPESLPQYHDIPAAVRVVFDQLRQYNQPGTCANGRGAILLDIIAQPTYHDAMLWAAKHGHHLILNSMLMHLSLASQDMSDTPEALAAMTQSVNELLKLSDIAIKNLARSTRNELRNPGDSTPDEQEKDKATEKQRAQYLEYLQIQCAQLLASKPFWHRGQSDPELFTRLPLLVALLDLHFIDPPGNNFLLINHLTRDGHYKTAQVLMRWSRLFWPVIWPYKHTINLTNYNHAYSLRDAPRELGFLLHDLSRFPELAAELDVNTALTLALEVGTNARLSSCSIQRAITPVG